MLLIIIWYRYFYQLEIHHGNADFNLHTWHLNDMNAKISVYRGAVPKMLVYLSSRWGQLQITWTWKFHGCWRIYPREDDQLFLLFLSLITDCWKNIHSLKWPLDVLQPFPALSVLSASVLQMAFTSILAKSIFQKSPVSDCRVSSFILSRSPYLNSDAPVQLYLWKESWQVTEHHHLSLY